MKDQEARNQINNLAKELGFYFLGEACVKSTSYQQIHEQCEEKIKLERGELAWKIVYAILDELNFEIKMAPNGLTIYKKERKSRKD